MIKVYEVSGKYIMLFMHDLLNWCTYFVAMNYTACTIVHREICEMFRKYFTKYFT